MRYYPKKSYLKEKNKITPIISENKLKMTKGKGKKARNEHENEHAYLSWPAVSQIWALTIFWSIISVFVWNSTPIVAFASTLNSFLENRAKSWDFPTAESPINTTLKT